MRRTTEGIGARSLPAKDARSCHESSLLHNISEKQWSAMRVRRSYIVSHSTISRLATRIDHAASRRLTSALVRLVVLRRKRVTHGG